MQRIIRNARKPPVRRPEKKPATMALAGKALHFIWGVGLWVAAGFEAAVLGTVVDMLGALFKVVAALFDAVDEADIVEDESF